MTLRIAGHLGVRSPDAPLLRHLAGGSDPVAQILLLAALGFAGASDNYLVLRPVKDQKRIAAALAASDLVMGSFVHDPLAWDRPTWSVTDRMGQAALAAALDVSLTAAAISGAKTITIVTGRDTSQTVERQMAAMAENLLAAGERAGRAGVSLCVEATHPSFAAGLLIERWRDALTLVTRVAHPAVRVNLDIGHVALHGDDPIEAITAISPWLGMIQAADIPGRIEPGAGRLDWSAITAALHRAGYIGLVELELEPAGEGKSGESALLERLAALEWLDFQTVEGMIADLA